MASNSLTAFGNANFIVGGLSVTPNFQLIYTMTGSTMAADVINVPTGSWVALNTASLSDVRYVFVQNVNSSSTGQIFISNNNTINVTGSMVTLGFGDWAFMPKTGSSTQNQLWASASGSLGQLTEVIIPS